MFTLQLLLLGVLGLGRLGPASDLKSFAKGRSSSDSSESESKIISRKFCDVSNKDCEVKNVFGIFYFYLPRLPGPLPLVSLQIFLWLSSLFLPVFFMALSQFLHKAAHFPCILIKSNPYSCQNRC